jgi:hypothetical protein
MKKAIISGAVGLLVGALAGALIMGVSQYFEGSWPSEGDEAGRWVYMSATTGGLLGAVAGAFVGLIMGLVNAKDGRG